jgi:hypothetical protein
MLHPCLLLCLWGRRTSWGCRRSELRVPPANNGCNVGSFRQTATSVGWSFLRWRGHPLDFQLGRKRSFLKRCIDHKAQPDESSTLASPLVAFSASLSYDTFSVVLSVSLTAVHTNSAYTSNCEHRSHVKQQRHIPSSWSWRSGKHLFLHRLLITL